MNLMGWPGSMLILLFFSAVTIYAASYAWQRRSLPGARIFAYIILAGTLIFSIAGGLLLPNTADASFLILSALLFTGSSLLISRSIFRYRFLDVSSLAHDLVLESIRDGILVFDQGDRLIDMNIPARRMVRYTSERITGKKIEQVAPDWSATLAGFVETCPNTSEIEREGRYYELTCTNLVRHRQAPVGKFVVIRDITSRKQAEDTAQDALRMAEKRANELSILKDLAEILNQTLPPDQALQAGLEQVARQVESPAGWFITTSDDGMAEVVAGFHLPGAMELARSAGQRYPLCDCLKQTMSHQLITPRMFDCERLPGMNAAEGDPKQHLTIPVRAGGIPVGNLNLVFPSTRTFTETEMRLLSALGDQFGGALERARLFREAHRLAITDPLTGLYNRRHFFEITTKEMERARRYSHPISLAILDIDHFKNINDTYGHLTGDFCLQEVARFCQEAIRQIDLLGRFGGEEIVILMPETGEQKAVQAVERLRSLVERQEIHTPKSEIKLTISVGVASLAEGRWMEIDAFFDLADQALYQAKNSGRNQVRVL